MLFEWEAVEHSYIQTLGITVEDVLTNDPARFGQIAELTNGVLLRVENDKGNTLFAFNDGDPIKKNGDWGRMAHAVSRNALSNKLLCIIYTTSTHPFNMSEGYKIVAEIRDNLTTMISFTICTGGFKYP